MTRNSFVIFATIAGVLGLGACSESHCALEPVGFDAATLTCDESDPCCEVGGVLSAPGALCRSSFFSLCDESAVAFEVVSVPTCSGRSGECDGPLMEVDAQRIVCRRGYDCSPASPICGWVGESDAH